MGFDRKKRRDFKAPGEAEWTRAIATTAVTAGQVVRAVSTPTGDAYYDIVPAIADGSQAGELWITVASALAGNSVWVVPTAQAALDTSAGTLGDRVYLSASVAGALTLTTSPEAVGTITRVAVAGSAILHPATAGADASAWISLNGSEVAGWTNAGNTSEYRVVGDVVEMRGFVLADSGTTSLAAGGIYTAWPPAALQPATGDASAPMFFSNDTGVTLFAGALFVTTKVQPAAVGSTGTPTVGDVIWLDGLRWSLSP